MSLGRKLFPGSTSSAPDPITTDLKLHWNTAQTSGSGATGTLNALVGSATGDMVDSADVNKSSGQTDSAGNEGWLFQDGGSTNTQLVASQDIYTFMGSSGTNWSVEIWARIDSKQASDSVFFNSWQSTENFIIGLYGASSSSTEGGMHSLVKTSGGNNYVNVGSNLNYGSFAQYVVVADNTTVKTYVNGSADGSVSNTTGAPNTGSANFVIGGRYSYTDKSWNGLFRICRVYAKALSASEVLNNFNANKADFGL